MHGTCIKIKKLTVFCLSLLISTISQIEQIYGWYRQVPLYSPDFTATFNTLIFIKLFPIFKKFVHIFMKFVLIFMKIVPVE